MNVPAPLASVPQITHTYGVNRIGVCYFISQNDSIATIEKFSLVYGPEMVILFVSSIAMVAIVIKLVHIVRRRSKYEPINDGDQFLRALKQLLPLSIFPMLFLVFIIPVLTLSINLATTNSTPKNALSFSSTLFISMWGASSGTTLIIHLSVVRCYAIRKRKIYSIDAVKIYLNAPIIVQV